MKFTQFIYASFVASTAWAGSDKPLAFFVKIKEGFLPLVDSDLFPKYGVTPFEIGDSSSFPTKVSFKDNQAYTSRGRVGYYSSMLVHGDRADMLTFNKINTGYYFHLCSQPESHEKLVYVNSVHDTCSTIEIYLLEYNPITGYPEGKYEAGYEGGYEGRFKEDDKGDNKESSKVAYGEEDDEGHGRGTKEYDGRH